MNAGTTFDAHAKATKIRESGTSRSNSPVQLAGLFPYWERRAAGGADEKGEQKGRRVGFRPGTAPSRRNEVRLAPQRRRRSCQTFRTVRVPVVVMPITPSLARVRCAVERRPDRRLLAGEQHGETFTLHPA